MTGLAPPAHAEWFFLAFTFFWLAICGVLSWVGGWHELSHRFRSDNLSEGERFRFRSGAMGRGLFPVSYNNCLFATVGTAGIALSILFPFRFMHPPLMIPWSAVDRCERVRLWFMDLVEVHIAGFERRVLLSGALGEKVHAAWSEAKAKR